MVFQRLRAFVRRGHPYIAAVRRHPYFVAVRSHPYVTATIAAVRDSRHVFVLSLQVIAFLVAMQFFLAGCDVMQARYEERYWAALKAKYRAENIATMTPLEQEVFGVDEPVVVTPADMEQWARRPDSELYYPDRPRYIYTVNGEKVPILGPRKPQVVNPEDQGPWIERGWSTADDTPPAVEESSADDDGTQYPGTDESTMAEPEMGTSYTSTTTPRYEVTTNPLDEVATLPPADVSSFVESVLTSFVETATTVIAQSTTTKSVLTESVRTRESITSVTVIDSTTFTPAGQATMNSGPTTISISMKVPLLPTIVTLAMSDNITAVFELEAIATSATDPITSGIAGTVAALKNMTMTGGATSADLEKLGKWWPGTPEQLIDFIHKPRMYNKSEDRLWWSRRASDRFWAEMGELCGQWLFGPQLLATSKGLMKHGIQQLSLLDEALDWACRTAMPQKEATYGLWVVCLARNSRQ